MLKGESVIIRSLVLPQPKEGEKNPFLTDDGQLKDGIIHKSHSTSIGFQVDASGGTMGFSLADGQLLKHPVIVTTEGIKVDDAVILGKYDVDVITIDTANGKWKWKRGISCG